jgi:hypothetical protein
VKVEGRIGGLEIDNCCVFVCGTGHDHHEYDTLLFPKLYRSLLERETKRLDRYGKKPNSRINQKAYLIDGPGSEHEKEKPSLVVKKNIYKVMTGMGLEDKAKKCVSNLMTDDPKNVVLVGHSRGAVICFEIAKRLNTEWLKRGYDKKRYKIHIFAIDPVNMSQEGVKDGETLDGYVQNFNIMLMANVSKSNIYPLTIPESQKREIHLMPGTHGTATQMHDDQVIGLATYFWIRHWMHGIGVRMLQPKDSYKSMQLKNFNKINTYNPWVVIGGELGRAIYDYDHDEANFRPVGNRRKRLRAGKESHRLSLLQQDDYHLIYHPDYVNRHHYTLKHNRKFKAPKPKKVPRKTKDILKRLDESLRVKDQKTAWNVRSGLHLHERILTQKKP